MIRDGYIILDGGGCVNQELLGLYAQREKLENQRVRLLKKKLGGEDVDIEISEKDAQIENLNKKIRGSNRDRASRLHRTETD